jgi:UDPglucose 6-dehydrogenase
MENAAIKHVKTIFMSSTEAESVKLFANSYLAMRVAYFNELDSFALQMNLNAKNIINGISLDQRIGNFYNNPSFGYGGYCLPKDTKQLLSSYKNVPQDLIKAIVNSNNTRKEFIAKKIIEKNPNTVGFYRLIMKSGSDNNRFSSIHDIIKKIQSVGIETFVFEPTIKDQNVINGSVIINDLDKFKNLSEIVVANRISEDLNNIKEKVFSRDIFNID